MNITKNTLLNIGLLLCTTAWASDNIDVKTFELLKKAIIKQQPDPKKFEALFNKRHPNATESAARELTKYVDVFFNEGPEYHPPVVIVGNKLITLNGKLAHIACEQLRQQLPPTIKLIPVGETDCSGV